VASPRRHAPPLHIENRLSPLQPAVVVRSLVEDHRPRISICCVVDRVQGCIVLGVISFAAEKSGNITLKILSAVLSLMVLLTASRLYSVRVSVTMHVLQRRPRVAKILSGALTYGTLFLVLDVGYRIVHSTYDALIAIQSVR
jgi:hypothetical protein